MRPLYCDESIWIPVADGLRRRGWTVYTAPNEGRLGDPDREHLSYALENDWILVTFDDDFLSFVEGTGLEHAGIIYVQQAGRDIGGVVKAVDAHLENREEGTAESTIAEQNDGSLRSGYTVFRAAIATNPTPKREASALRAIGSTLQNVYTENGASTDHAAGPR